MKLHTAPAILSVAVIASLLLPAGAIVGTMGAPSEDVFDGEPSVEMAAYDGPDGNGQYVETGADGEIRIDLADPGVTTNALTGIERVVNITNTDTTSVTVWVSHDGGDAVTLYNDATGAPIEAESSAIELSPGEAITMSIDIDSTGAEVNEQLLSTVTLHAKYDATASGFGVTIDEIPSGVSEGETVSVKTTVTNNGDTAGTETVELVVDGEVVDQREVSLGAGNSTAVAFSFDANRTDATVTVRAGGSSSQRTVAVAPLEFDVTIDAIPAEVSEGETVAVNTTVTNTGDAAGTQTVEFVVNDEVVDRRDVSLNPGESTGVDFSFEAGSDDATVTVRAGDNSSQRTVTVTTPTASSGGGGGGGAPDTDGIGNLGEDGSSNAEVVFDDGGDTSEVEVRTVDVRELDTDPMEDPDRPPLAVINSEDAETRADDPADGPDAEAFDVLTLVGEPVDLSGERSKIGAAESVSNRDRITQLVDIDVPTGREDQPATVRLRVDRDRLGDVEADRTMIGHRTEEGWELLETRVVDRTEEGVIVEARTPGFSYFAVFSPPNVKYEWELSDGTELEGDGTEPCLCTAPTFEEPGLHEVQLTVTDRFGRQSSTTHRVLANDVPEATIEVVDRDGDQVTLAANVTDEVGATEVTWTFPDGTEVTGQEVTHTLEPGEHEIELHVVDEYGAEAESEHTVAVGPPGSPAAVADAFGMDLELLIQVGLLSGIGLALAIGYRQFPWGLFAWRPRRGPKITVFRAPTVDVEARRFVIEELAAEDPSCELDTITIEVLEADRRSLVEKRLDISGMTTYTASPETLAVPPGVAIDPDGSYTIRIKVTDTDGRSTERDLSAIHAVDRQPEQPSIR